MISADAAHFKTSAKGQIYTYSMLTGTNKIYILGFGIAEGNKNFENWE